MAGHLVPGMMKVLIEGAKDLENLVSSGEQQPFYILECGAQRSRSKVSAHGGGLSPAWNTAHKFALTTELVMKVTVKDESTRGVIGTALIDLGRARATGRDDSATPLTTLGGHTKGLLQFKLKFSPMEGMVPDEDITPPRSGGLAPAGPADATDGLPAARRSAAGAGAGPGAGPAAGEGAGPVGRPASALDPAHDPTLQSVNDKVTLAKAAMQQLQAELAEMTAAGSSRAPSSRGAGAGPDASPLGSDFSAPFGGAGPGGLRSAAQATPTGSQRGSHPVTPAYSGASAGGAEAAAVGGAGHVMTIEEIVQQYSRTAADQGGGMVMSSKAMCEAIEALYQDKAAAEEELSSVKHAMASLTQQHYMELKRARDAANAHSSPAAGSPLAAAAAANAAAKGSSTGGAAAAATATAAAATQAAAAKPLRRNYEARATLDSDDGGGGSPVAAHRLEIQVHQQERQIAAQAAKIEAQAAEVKSLRADLDTARGASRESQVRADAASRDALARLQAAEARATQAEALAAAARAEAEAARTGVASAGAKESTLAAEVAALKAALAAEAADKRGALEAAAAAESMAQASNAALTAELSRLREEADGLRAEAAAAPGLREQLEEARAELDLRAGQADEVEYLQQQLRRTLRQVVELQRDVQSLKASRGSGGGHDAGSSAVSTENEFLMQELVATKVELAQLKEQQLVVHRQLRQASAMRSGSGGVHE